MWFSSSTGTGLSGSQTEDGPNARAASVSRPSHRATKSEFGQCTGVASCFAPVGPDPAMPTNGAFGDTKGVTVEDGLVKLSGELEGSGVLAPRIAAAEGRPAGGEPVPGE